MQPMDRGHVLSIHDGPVADFADVVVGEQDRDEMPRLVDDPADVVVIRAAEAACGVGTVSTQINHGTPPVAGVDPILA